jgi:hypothetical protein
MLPQVTNPERIACLQGMLSGFCHRCRNSLNGIKISLYLFRSEQSEPIPASWGELEQTCLRIERLFDHLQAIYRPLTLTMVRSPLGEFMVDHEPKWRHWFEATGRTLRVDCPSEDRPGDFDPIHLGMGLDAIVAWRAEAGEAGRHPRLSWRTGDGHCQVSWDESGAPPAEVLSNRQGQRAGENTDTPRVGHLALPLLSRIVAAHGGHTESTREPEHAFCLKLRWPQFRSPSPSS